MIPQPRIDVHTVLAEAHLFANCKKQLSIEDCGEVYWRSTYLHLNAFGRIPKVDN